MKTVVGIFSSQHTAEKAVNELRNAGFDQEISIVTSSKEHSVGREGGTTVTGGAATGGVIGGIAGLALGASAVAIPGIGPLLAAGPIAAILTGAATGGIAGGLVDWGITRSESKKYENELRSGKILAFVNAKEGAADEASHIMRNHGAERVSMHSTEY